MEFIISENRIYQEGRAIDEPAILYESDLGTVHSVGELMLAQYRMNASHHRGMHLIRLDGIGMEEQCWLMNRAAAGDGRLIVDMHAHLAAGGELSDFVIAEKAGKR